MTEPVVIDLQPQPARKAGRNIGALSLVAGAAPTCLMAFEVINWTGDQVGA
jgi:hypothetical protein